MKVLAVPCYHGCQQTHRESWVRPKGTGAGGLYSCTCSDGFEDSNGICAALNVCDYARPCQNGAECSAEPDPPLLPQITEVEADVVAGEPSTLRWCYRQAVSNLVVLNYSGRNRRVYDVPADAHGAKRGDQHLRHLCRLHHAAHVLPAGLVRSPPGWCPLPGSHIHHAAC